MSRHSYLCDGLIYYSHMTYWYTIRVDVLTYYFVALYAGFTIAIDSLHGVLRLNSRLAVICSILAFFVIVLAAYFGVCRAHFFLCCSGSKSAYFFLPCVLFFAIELNL